MADPRINDVLGRRAKRVVFDQEERIILNAGEVITHEAVERARVAGVLEELLSAATIEEPRFSVEERAHTPGEIRYDRAKEAEKKLKKRPKG